MTCPDWKEFERLVALVERHLLPEHSVVRLSDRIPDRDTGQLREVDAAIRLAVGSTPILITIECRRRDGVEDVRWIEELAQKKRSVGATATLAVSSMGFTAPALEKARALGIETRVLHEVTDETVRSWSENIEVDVIQATFTMGPPVFRLKPTPANPNPILHPKVMADCLKGDVNYKFIRGSADQDLQSIGDILRDTDRRNGDAGRASSTGEVSVLVPGGSSVSIPVCCSFPSLFADVPVDAPSVAKQVTFTFASGEAAVDTELGPAELESMTVDVYIVQRRYRSPIGQLFSYDKADSSLAAAERREVCLGRGRIATVLLAGTVDTETPAIPLKSSGSNAVPPV